MKFLLYSMAILGLMLADLEANVSSSTGTVRFDTNNDETPEATLDQNGLLVGSVASPSVKLQVQGNAIITTSMNIGSSQTAGTNLKIGGSLGQSYQTINADGSIGDHSLVFADSSLGNIMITLPDARLWEGRMSTIKKIASSNTVILNGGLTLIDECSSYLFPSGSRGYLKVMSDGDQWRVLAKSSELIGFKADVQAVANAYVSKSNPTSDQDESEDILIKSDGSNANSRLAYLRFNSGSLTSTDTIFLELYVDQISNADVSKLSVFSLNDGTAGETTWDSSLTWNTRPDGTGNVPTGDMTSSANYGYITQSFTGNISIPIDGGVYQSLITSDTNDEITMVLSHDVANTIGIARISSLSNSSGLPIPSLRVLAASEIQTVEESTYGGQLTEASETTFSYDQGSSTSKVGEGGGSNANEYIQFLLFQLPSRPPGGFHVDDTSLRLTISSEDVETDGETADLWAVGYVPAGNIGDVGSNLNNAGVTDIDDFFLSEANLESKNGWNTGTDDTQKIWDNMASRHSLGTLATPPEANLLLTSYINGLYDNHGASAGDFLVLRINYDSNLTDYDDWIFNTGDASSGRPTLTLTKD